MMLFILIGHLVANPIPQLKLRIICHEIRKLNLFEMEKTIPVNIAVEEENLAMHPGTVFFFLTEENLPADQCVL